MKPYRIYKRNNNLIIECANLEARDQLHKLICFGAVFTNWNAEALQARKDVRILANSMGCDSALIDMHESNR